MNTWFNMSHPQTMQAAVFLGYLSGLFGLFGLPGRLGPLGDLMVAMGLIGGAFLTANNKRVGFYLLAGASIIRLLLSIDLLLLVDGLIPIMRVINGTVFPAALVVAVLHSHSRNYQKIWFE